MIVSCPLFDAGEDALGSVAMREKGVARCLKVLKRVKEQSV